MRLEPWEEAWILGVCAWEAEMIGQPGLLTSECCADVLDSQGPEKFLSWYSDKSDY